MENSHSKNKTARKRAHSRRGVERGKCKGNAANQTESKQTDDEEERLDSVTVPSGSNANRFTMKSKTPPRRSLRLMQIKDRQSRAVAKISSSRPCDSNGGAIKKWPRTKHVTNPEEIAPYNQPKPKKWKLKTLNLEYLPFEILRKIFAGLDDDRSMCLAEMSYRMAAVPQTVFEKRFANEYVVVNGEKSGADSDV